MRRNLSVNPSPSLASQGRRPQEWAGTEFCAGPEKGGRRGWCGSENNQHEVRKPKSGGNDRHEPQAEVDQKRVTARDLRISGSTAQEQPNNSEQQRGPRVGQPGAPRTHAAFASGSATPPASRLSTRAGRNSVTSASTAGTPWKRATETRWLPSSTK